MKLNKFEELLFEGKYLSGKYGMKKRNEYNLDNELLYEGNYLNGQRNCDGKFWEIICCIWVK